MPNLPAISEAIAALSPVTILTLTPYLGPGNGLFGIDAWRVKQWENTQQLPLVLGLCPRYPERAIALGGKGIDDRCCLGLVLRSKLGEADNYMRSALCYEKRLAARRL